MLKIPYECPRGFDDCIALSNIISDDGNSFFCCGENNGSGRAIEQDIYTLCFKGELDDRISNYDKRDLIHQSSVITLALAVIEKSDKDPKDWSPWDNENA